MLIYKQPFKMSYKIGALKTFAKFPVKLLRRSKFKVYKLIGWVSTKRCEICSSRNTRKVCEIYLRF